MKSNLKLTICLVALTVLLSQSLVHSATVTKSIGAGKDYETVALWEAASYGATASDDAIGELYGTVVSSTATTINDVTPLSTTLRAVSGQEHDGTPGSGATWACTGTVMAYLLGAHNSFVFENLEFEMRGNTAAAFYSWSSNSGMTFDKCIFWGTGAGAGGSYIFSIFGAGTSTTIQNCLLCDFAPTTTGDVAAILATNTGAMMKLMNNTITNISGGGNVWGMGIAVDDANHEYRNNLVTDITATGTALDYAWSTHVNATTSNNISEDATSPDTSYRSKTITFVDTGTSDYHLASSETDAIDQGSTDADVPADDIDGDTRDVSPDIGMDEYIAVGAGIVPILQRHYRGRR